VLSRVNHLPSVPLLNEHMSGAIVPGTGGGAGGGSRRARSGGGRAVVDGRGRHRRLHIGLLRSDHDAIEPGFPLTSRLHAWNDILRY
jgi:hypothetical protein